MNKYSDLLNRSKEIIQYYGIKPDHKFEQFNKMVYYISSDIGLISVTIYEGKSYIHLNNLIKHDNYKAVSKRDHPVINKILLLINRDMQLFNALISRSWISNKGEYDYCKLLQLLTIDLVLHVDNDFDVNNPVFDLRFEHTKSVYHIISGTEVIPHQPEGFNFSYKNFELVKRVEDDYSKIHKAIFKGYDLIDDHFDNFTQLGDLKLIELY